MCSALVIASHKNEKNVRMNTKTYLKHQEIILYEFELFGLETAKWEGVCIEGGLPKTMNAKRRMILFFV